MMQRAPARSISAIQRSRASGVRWAESTRASYPMPKSSSTLAAWDITSQSEVLPITTPIETPGGISGLQLDSGKALERFAVLFRGARDDLGREPRSGRRLVPVERFQAL